MLRFPNHFCFNSCFSFMHFKILCIFWKCLNMSVETPGGGKRKIKSWRQNNKKAEHKNRTDGITWWRFAISCEISLKNTWYSLFGFVNQRDIGSLFQVLKVWRLVVSHLEDLKVRSRIDLVKGVKQTFVLMMWNVDLDGFADAGVDAEAWGEAHLVEAGVEASVCRHHPEGGVSGAGHHRAGSPQASRTPRALPEQQDGLGPQTLRQRAGEGQCLTTLDLSAGGH